MVDKKKTAITIAEAKELLERVNEEEADQIQKRSIDYTAKFSRSTPEKAKRARETLVKECGFTEEEAVELVNTLPTSLEELRVFTSAWKKLVPTEILEKTLKILSRAEA